MKSEQRLSSVMVEASVELSALCYRQQTYWKQQWQPHAAWYQTVLPYQVFPTSLTTTRVSGNKVYEEKCKGEST
jgi:hypothetical protein